MAGDDCAQDRRDLWDAVNEQRKQGTRVEVMLAEIKTMLTERCGICTRTQSEHGERLDALEESEAKRKGQKDHETRIVALEDAENKRKGGMAVLLALASAAGAVAAVLIKVFWK